MSIGSADAHLRTLAEWIDSARPHVADMAAQAQIAKATKRLHLVVPIPGGQHVERTGLAKYLLSSRVDRSFLTSHSYLVSSATEAASCAICW